MDGDILPALYAAPLQADNLPQFKKPSGGMFGGGGKFGLKEALAFGLAGLVSRQNPMLLQGLMGAVMQRQRQQQEEQDYQRRRNDQFSDFQARRDYEISHPMPQQPGEFEQVLMASGIQPGTPEWAKAMTQRRDNLLDPIVNTALGPVLRSAVTGANQPPSAPVGKLTPINDGGPSLGGSGGFPRHY